MQFDGPGTKVINETFKKAIVTVSIDPDLAVLKFDVDVNSLPVVNDDDLPGVEQVVEFKVHNFTNNNTFFTDSNGLEMQKRILNYRPTWDIEKNYKDSPKNITANFYPITSAMSMKEVNSDRVFTVMNDRPQSGSSLSPGTFQFMHNRRIHLMDGRGMGEYLDETDAFGNGIRVKATYNV